MSNFDGWETQLYGDAVALPGQLSDNELMHFRTKGSKNGVRRFQQPDGTWTPLGLKERRAREGFGEGRHARKADKVSRRLAKNQKKLARQQKRAVSREEFRKRMAAARNAFQSKTGTKRSLRGLSDDELKAKINRLKMEQEYRSLNKNPVLETGKNLVSSYLNYKSKKLENETKKTELRVKADEALAKKLNAKAALSTARGDIFDNIIGGKGKMKAKAELLKSKRQNTVRGKIGEAVGNIISKEGKRIVNEMGDQSLVMRGGRFVKRNVKRGAEAAKGVARGVYTGVREGREQAHEEMDRVRNSRHADTSRDTQRQERRQEREYQRSNAQLRRSYSDYQRRVARQERRRENEYQRSNAQLRRSYSDYQRRAAQQERADRQRQEQARREEERRRRRQQQLEQRRRQQQSARNYMGFG